jgi:hypothetical protein
LRSDAPRELDLELSMDCLWTDIDILTELNVQAHSQRHKGIALLIAHKETALLAHALLIADVGVALLAHVPSH